MSHLFFMGTIVLSPVTQGNYEIHQSTQ